MNEDELLRIFRVAKNVATFSNYKVKMSAILIHHGKIISTGFNQIKSNPGQWSYGDKVSIHAEANCIKGCLKKNFEGATMIVYRESKGRNPMPRIARPCSECFDLCRKFGIRKVIYTVNDFPWFEIEYL